MLYTNPNIRDLPTLLETTDILRDLVVRFPVIHRGPFTPIVNDEDLFILTRTNTMYSIKPNITRQGAIFGWMNSFDISHPDKFKASIFNDARPNYLLNNVIKEDAEILFESHPLYKLLQNGINLPKLRRPIKVYNPYGVAHAYGIKSHLISLSSSLDIAAFHACHKFCLEENRFIPITDPDKSGLIFIFELSAPFSMIPNLSTIGMQAFQRPGRNRLFSFQANPNTIFCSLPFVKGFQFRHTKESSSYFSNLFNQGATLFPDELVAHKVAAHLRQRHFSENAFIRNLQFNPHDNPNQNLAKLNACGYTMDKQYSCVFSPQELRSIWFDDVERRWRDFWDVVVTPMMTDEQREMLLDLPNNNDYRSYFMPEV